MSSQESREGGPVVRYAAAHAAITMAILLAGGCGSADAGDPAAMEVAVERRDSAGVVIVKSRGAPTLWTVGAPDLDLGDGAMGPDYELFQVRGARVLADGRIAIANDGSKEIRVYDTHGTYQEAWGRAGDGPGEFNVVGQIAPTADGGVWALDPLRDILTRFDAAGEVASTERLGTNFPGAGITVDFFDDGRMLLPAMDGFNFDTPDGLYRRTFTWNLYDPGADAVVDLGQWSGLETYVETQGRGVRAGILAFGGASEGTLTSDGRVHIGEGMQPELRTFDRDGNLLRIARWEADQLPADPIVEATRAAALVDAEDPDARRWIEARYGAVPRGRLLPAFVAVTAGSGGEVWVQSYPIPGEPTVGWEVLGDTGAHVASVGLPTGFVPMEITADFLIGVLRDEFDVEHVLRLPLDRTGG